MQHFKNLLEARDRAASNLLEEQRRREDLAEREREKTAALLRTESARLVEEAYERLREHIRNQIRTVEAALLSADHLENARIKAIEAQIDGVQREVGLVNEASERAISKAEMATGKRFESVNEFREEARSVREQQQKDLARLAESLMPREVANAKFVEFGKLIEAIEYREQARKGRDEGINWTIGIAVAVLGVIISLVVVLANVVT